MDSRAPTTLTFAVRDLDRSLAFWLDGLRVPLKLRAGRRAELQTEGVLVVLREDPAAEPTTGGPVLGWEVDDLDETVRRLEDRGVAVERIPARPEEADGRRAVFHDPDGHRLELVCYS